jgi:hypothetical protein
MANEIAGFSGLNIFLVILSELIIVECGNKIGQGKLAHHQTQVDHRALM